MQQNFEDGISDFFQETQNEHTAILREATKRVKNSIVRRAPIAEGDYLAEWDASLHTWPSDTKQPPDTKRRVTRKRLQAPIDRMKMGDSYFLENTDPVAERLEFGYSDQAPQGVVRITAIKWGGFVRGAARAATNRIRKRLGQ